MGKKSLDFYLPEYNIGIECQGRQHFIFNSYFGSFENFVASIDRDILKNELCNQNAISLFYVVNKSIYNNNIFTDNLFKNIYLKENVIISDMNNLKESFIEFLNKQGIKTKN